MSEFVKKTIMGYKTLDGGQSDPECSHVILTLKEYEGLLQKISQAEQETRNEKRKVEEEKGASLYRDCLLYTSPSPRDRTRSRMPSSA